MIRRIAGPLLLTAIQITLGGLMTGYGSPTAAAQLRYYRSNATAMLLEEITEAERDDYRYHLVRDQRDPERELRRLFEDGEEKLVQRLEFDDGRLSSKTELTGEQVLRRYEYGEGRRVKVEERFRDGELDTRLEYEYDGHQITQVSVFDAEGTRLYRDRYSYRDDGRLRRVVREGKLGGDQAEADAERFHIEFSFVDGQLRSEWHELGEHSTAVRYDAVGRIAQLMVWAGEDHERIHEYRYHSSAPDSAVEVERIQVPGRELEEWRRNDSAGRVVERVLMIGGETVERDEYEYENGLLVQERRYREEDLRVVRYEYDEQERLQEERWTRNGVPELLREYRDDERMSELHFRHGSAVLRVEYRGGQRLREEVLRDGEVVRVREYAAE